MRKTEEAIFDVTGVATTLFRPPRGFVFRVRPGIVVDRFGLQMILWTISTLDWRRDMRPKKVVRRVMRYAHPGAILTLSRLRELFSVGGRRSVDYRGSLPLVIDALRDAGYEILPVSEMLERIPATDLEPERMLERA